jgi:hypothetical protein
MSRMDPMRNADMPSWRSGALEVLCGGWVVVLGIMPIKIRLGNVLGSNRFFGLGSTEKQVEMGELQ